MRGGQRQCARSDAGQQRVERLHAVETKTLRIARWLLPCGRLDGVAPGLIRLAGHAAGSPRKRGRIVLTAARATHFLALAGRVWATPRCNAGLESLIAVSWAIGLQLHRSPWVQSRAAER